MAGLRDLLELRAAAVSAMRQLTDHPAGEGGDLSDEQVQAFDRHKGELENLEARISRQQTVDDAERRMAAPAIIHGNGRDGQFEVRARGFSLVRAINATLGEDVDAGFEREISSEVKRRSGRPFHGIAVPDQYFQVERRVVTTGTSDSPGAAQDLYPYVHRPDLFIDMLRSSLVIGRLGATILDGLVGSQDIPRQSAAGTAEWLGEEGALTPSDAAFDDVELAPHTGRDLGAAVGRPCRHHGHLSEVEVGKRAPLALPALAALGHDEGERCPAGIARAHQLQRVIGRAGVRQIGRLEMQPSDVLGEAQRLGPGPGQHLGRVVVAQQQDVAARGERAPERAAGDDLGKRADRGRLIEDAGVAVQLAAGAAQLDRGAPL